LRDAAAWLASHAKQPAPDDFDPEALADFARKAEEKQKQAAAHFAPVIALLRGALRMSHGEFEADVQQLLTDSIEALEGWLAFYQSFSKLLARQAAEGALLAACCVPSSRRHRP
jgi:phage tail tape-measure protein